MITTFSVDVHLVPSPSDWHSLSSSIYETHSIRLVALESVPCGSCLISISLQPCVFKAIILNFNSKVFNVCRIHWRVLHLLVLSLSPFYLREISYDKKISTLVIWTSCFFSASGAYSSLTTNMREQTFWGMQVH